MKIIYIVSACLLVILGVGHTLMTPNFYPGFSADALWFAGTGLLLLLLGLVNIIAIRLLDRSLVNLCVGANLVGVVFLILVTIAIPEVQAFIALVAAFGSVISAFAFRKNALAVAS